MSGGVSGASGADQPVYNNTATVNNEALSNPWGAPAPPPAAPAVASSARVSPAAIQNASISQPSAASPTGLQEGGASPDPMAQYVQQMMSNPQMMQSMMGGSDMQSPMGMGGGAPATEPPPSPFQPGVNPMQQMMQQMMQNPAIMQQAAVMRQQMMNPQGQAMGGAPNPMHQMMQQMMNPQGQTPMGAANPAGLGAAAGGQPNLMQPNPMHQMMQQMMNPQGQAPMGGAANGAGGMAPNPMQQMLQQMSAGQPGVGAGAGGGAAAVPESVQKMQFASQLMQLANMGFSDESMCLRALAQHNGRLDSAIDMLLTGGVE